MNFLTEKISAEIKQYALKESPLESCGYIVQTQNSIVTVPGKNQAEDPENFFQIDGKTYLRASLIGKIIASYHSQQETGPSEMDKINSNGHSLPMCIYSLKENSFNIYTPTGYVNYYVGRSFTIGERDCLSLIRDYYFKELNIILNNYKRDAIWLQNPGNDYEENYSKEGFFKVESPRKHDMILFQFPNQKFASHAGIFIGNNLLLHHAQNRLSSIEPYGNLYKKLTHSILRHESFRTN